MASSCIKRLERAISDYLKWMATAGYAPTTIDLHRRRQLQQFLTFIENKNCRWPAVFAMDTFQEFKQHIGPVKPHAVIGLSRYLKQKGVIARHLHRKQQQHLPQIYEDYLNYQQKYGQAPDTKTRLSKRILVAFNDYFKKERIELNRLTITHVDAFMAVFFKNFAERTRSQYRTHIREFLSYLFHERQIIRSDLAPLVIGAPNFAQHQPPRYLRPDEVKKLFAVLKFDTASELRTAAIVYMAYTLGLRHKEICQIRLNDISFSKKQLTVKKRKNTVCLKLPIPDQTLKVISAYVVGARPKSERRTLFLTLSPPHRPMRPNTIGHHIKAAMEKAGICASAYWLRHTYAQNLLETGCSIYEIKQMLGHDSIESSKRYLHIHTSLMRKVIFDEEL